jgi:hypothetical protein
LQDHATLDTLASFGKHNQRDRAKQEKADASPTCRDLHSNSLRRFPDANDHKKCNLGRGSHLYLRREGDTDTEFLPALLEDFQHDQLPNKELGQLFLMFSFRSKPMSPARGYQPFVRRAVNLDIVRSSLCLSIQTRSLRANAKGWLLTLQHRYA